MKILSMTLLTHSDHNKKDIAMTVYFLPNKVNAIPKFSYQLTSN